MILPMSRIPGVDFMFWRGLVQSFVARGYSLDEAIMFADTHIEALKDRGDMSWRRSQTSMSASPAMW